MGEVGTFNQNGMHDTFVAALLRVSRNVLSLYNPYEVWRLRKLLVLDKNTRNHITVTIIE